MSTRATPLFVLLVIACGGVAPAPIDAGVSDAGTDAGSAEVLDCESAVDALIARCEGAASPVNRRLCVARAYRGACTTGRPEVIAAIARCLGSSPCESARSPGADAACVAAVVAASEDDAHRALDQAWCTCTPTETGCPGVPSVTASETTMLSDDDAARVTRCLSGCATPSFCVGGTSLGAALHMCDMVPP